MPGQRRPPQARDRALGAELKSIRQTQTKLSLEAAAKLLQWSLPTMSRTENGKRHVSPEDVATILAVYRVPIKQREALVSRAKADDEPFWWARHLPGAFDGVSTLASYEADAHTITDWSVNLIPGMLQTPTYMRACLEALGIPPDEAGKRCEARLRRQKRLPLIDYCAFISEAAIRTPFGSAGFREQLEHLAKATERGIGVRMIPEHQPHAGLMHSWMLLEFPNSPPILHVELLRSRVYLHDEETAPYEEQRTLLSQLAFSTAETRDMLKKLIERWEAR